MASDLKTPVPVSAAAERMRRHRRRRLKGLRYLAIELWEKEIDALVDRRVLEVGARENPNAIRKALYCFLESFLTRSK
jgi:hypothetical protein